jgi:hypothetical protein
VSSTPSWFHVGLDPRAIAYSTARVVKAGKQFHLVTDHLHRPALRARLEREFAELSERSCTAQ